LPCFFSLLRSASGEKLGVGHALRRTHKSDALAPVGCGPRLWQRPCRSTLQKLAIPGNRDIQNVSGTPASGSDRRRDAPAGLPTSLGVVGPLNWNPLNVSSVGSVSHTEKCGVKIGLARFCVKRSVHFIAAGLELPFQGDAPGTFRERRRQVPRPTKDRRPVFETASVKPAPLRSLHQVIGHWRGIWPPYCFPVASDPGGRRNKSRRADESSIAIVSTARDKHGTMRAERCDG